MAGHKLIIDPESELVFTLSPNEATPRCMMTLRHGGGTDESIAFKVCATYEIKLVPNLRIELYHFLAMHTFECNSEKSCTHAAAVLQLKTKTNKHSCSMPVTSQLNAFFFSATNMINELLLIVAHLPLPYATGQNNSTTSVSRATQPGIDPTWHFRNHFHFIGRKR